MPETHPKFSRSRRRTSCAEAFGYLQAAQPGAAAAGRSKAIHVGRLRHAQPVCPPGFLAKLPPVQTAIDGLQIADTCFYYPEDRGISESVRFGQLMAWAITEPAVWEAEGR